jgi:hypothetical protein
MAVKIAGSHHPTLGYYYPYNEWHFGRAVTALLRGLDVISADERFGIAFSDALAKKRAEAGAQISDDKLLCIVPISPRVVQELDAEKTPRGKEPPPTMRRRGPSFGM